MRIKRININNFRGFRNRSFSFDDYLTVVVGNNTSGKTSLLQAVQIALGAYLNSLKELRRFANKAYRRNFNVNDVYRTYNEDKKDFFSSDSDTSISVDADFFETYTGDNGEFYLVPEPISWCRTLKGNTTTHNRRCAGDLIDRVEAMESQRKDESGSVNAIYPLLLSYGADRIDNQYRSATKTKERESKVVKAYKSALLDTVDFKSAFDWIYKYEQSFKRGKEFEHTNEAFIKALETAIPALSDISIDSNNKELIAKVSVTGQEPAYHTFENMSDGFKSLICVVAEIAHRCIELNGFMGADAVISTPGIVIIDEIDLYLHPRWQRHVLQDLHNAFPKIQFIVSSHSPFIIQSVKSKNVITLDGVNDAEDPLKRSIEEIAISEMNMADVIRSREYNRMIEMAEKYYQLVKENREGERDSVELKKQLDDIEAEFSNDPAYIALLRAERNSK